MTSLLNSLIALVSDHAGWAYLTIGVAALLEAVPVFGSFVPGSTVIIGISALATVSHLSLPIMLVSAILGAGLGDGAAFWIGHRAQHRILAAWPLSAYPEIVSRSTAFFTKHGTLAVFLARFVPPVRAVIPLTAGALGMPPHHFYAVNLAAIVLWAPLHILPGALAGTLLQRWSAVLKPYEHIALVSVGVGVLLALAIWLTVLIYRRCAAASP